MQKGEVQEKVTCKKGEVQDLRVELNHGRPVCHTEEAHQKLYSSILLRPWNHADIGQVLSQLSGPGLDLGCD